MVKVQGKLKDGTIVDDYPTMVFIIGEYEVIDGLDLVVQSMYRNELSIVSIKPDMAYGEQGKTLFRNMRFMLDEMFQQNASKFAIYLEYENPRAWHFSVFILCYFIFFPNKVAQNEE